METLQTKLVLITKISAGITGVVSVADIILAILFMIYRFECVDEEAFEQQVGIWTVVRKTYIQGDVCPSHGIPGLVNPNTVYLIAILGLTFAILKILAASILFMNIPQRILATFGFICVWIGGLTTDLTLAILFGLDIRLIGNEIADSTTTFINVTDLATLALVRRGAVYLMTIALKGYVVYIISGMLNILMIIYTCNIFNTRNSELKAEERRSAVNLQPIRAYGPYTIHDSFEQSSQPSRLPSLRDSPRNGGGASPFNNRRGFRSPMPVIPEPDYNILRYQSALKRPY